MIRPIYMYITALLIGFTVVTLLNEIVPTRIDEKLLYDERSVTGVIKAYDVAHKQLSILTIDQLNYNNLSDSVYEVQLLLKDSTLLYEQSFVPRDGVLDTLTGKALIDKNALKPGDLVVVLYNSTFTGFEAEQVTKGDPLPAIGQFTPEFLELQALVRSATQQ